MVVFLADSSGQPANRIVLSLQNWTFLPVTLIQVLHHQVRGVGRGVKAFDDLDDFGGMGVQNLAKPDDVILERSLTSKISNIFSRKSKQNSKFLGLLQTFEKSYY